MPQWSNVGLFVTGSVLDPISGCLTSIDRHGGDGFDSRLFGNLLQLDGFARVRGVNYVSRCHEGAAVSCTGNVV